MNGAFPKSDLYSPADVPIGERYLSFSPSSGALVSDPKASVPCSSEASA
jgi:hypothetical protein